jgi:hypothetical protein
MYAPYKNDTLRMFGDAMTKCGIPPREQRLFVQQVLQENGSLDPSITGGTDMGWSFGIGQWYKYPVKAKRWLELHPEQATIEWQTAALAESSCAAFNRYPGDIRRAIVSHNCPECAIHNAVPKACGGVDSYHKIDPRGSKRRCYYNDEVNSEASVTRLVWAPSF